MSRIEQITDDFLKHDMNLVVSSVHGGNAQFLINTMYELGINKNHNILFFNFDGPIFYYETLLLARISLQKINDVRFFLQPCMDASKAKEVRGKEKIFNAINHLQKSKIIMMEINSFLLIDPVDYILKYNEQKNKIIIIQYFNQLVKMSKYSLEEILQKFKDYTKNKKVTFLLSYVTCEKLELMHLWPRDLDMNMIKKYVGNVCSLFLSKRQSKRKRIWFYSKFNNTMQILEVDKNTLQIFDP